MLIAVSCALLALALLAYRRQFAGRDGAWLLAFRFPIVLLLAAVVVGQVGRLGWTERPRRVVVLLDRSASMRAAAAETTAGRAAVRFRVPDGVSRQDWVFAETALAAAGRSSAVDSGRTRMGRALELAAGTRPGAIVLVSDGQDNGDTDPVAAALHASVPVYTVGVGRGEGAGVELTGVDVPATVYAGDTVAARVSVLSWSPVGGSVGVRFAGQSRQMHVGPEPLEQDVEFRLVFDRPGRRALEAVADSLPTEVNRADNRRTAFVDVRPARVRVAYVTNRPGFNSRFVRDALGRNPRVELRAAFDGAQMRVVDSADVLILDGVTESGEAGELFEAVSRRVGSGAGLLVLAGPEFNPGPELTRLLPLATTGRPDTGVFTAVTTGEGKYLDWLGGRQGVVPPFRGVFGGAVRDSRARVLLEAAGTAEPLLILGRTGRGQVAFLTAFPLWRWGFGPEFQPGQTPLDELLAGLVRCLSDSDTVRFRLTSDKPGYLAGEQIRLRLTAERSDRTAWPGLSVWLRTDRQRQPMTETRAGIYEVVVRPAAGDWAVEAEVRADDSVVGSASTSFAVSAQSIELARTGLNSALLRRIAQVSGGRYHSADSLPRDASGVRLGTYRRGLVLDPRRTVWCYAAVALLAGVELALRRRKGLL